MLVFKNKAYVGRAEVMHVGLFVAGTGILFLQYGNYSLDIDFSCLVLSEFWVFLHLTLTFLSSEDMTSCKLRSIENPDLGYVPPTVLSEFVVFSCLCQLPIV